MMEAVQTSETSVNLYQSARCHNPEDGSHLHTHRLENVNSFHMKVSCTAHTKFVKGGERVCGSLERYNVRQSESCVRA
jgi:hypothetical protein